MRSSGKKISSFWASTIWYNQIMGATASLSSHNIEFVQGWRKDLIRKLGVLQCTVNSFLHRLLSVLIRITWDIFNIEKRLTFQFILHFSYLFNYWIAFC